MDSRNPNELITEVKQEQQTRSELATEALQWFLDDNVGELFPRGDVVDRLSDEFDITNRQANTAISDTVGDIVDPVQQMVKESTAYVGVIEYNVYSDEGAYGYIHFDDRVGAKKRVVCARCVEKHEYDENISHATQGEGTNSDDSGWDSLLNKVTAHYSESHTKGPQQVKPGASLISNTTISGNTAVHTGNQSLVDHDLIGGISSGDHHGRYSDGEAQSAIEGSASVSQVGFSNIESPSVNRAVGIDDSEGPMYRDSGGTVYLVWNTKHVNEGNAIDITGGVGASSSPVTIEVDESQLNVTGDAAIRAHNYVMLDNF